MSFPEITVAMTPQITAEDVEYIPEDLNLLHTDGCHFFRVPIAESEDGQWLVTIDVGYREREAGCPCDGIKPIDFAVFGFEITVFDQWNSQMFQTMDPREARAGIPDEIRHLLVDITKKCYLELVSICDPMYIYRFTWLESPTGNALNKHEACTESLMQAGYSMLREGTNKQDRMFWLLGKSDCDHSDIEATEAAGQLGVAS
jgi:hypothetical protein